jgi:hypothetical protein
MTWRLAGGYCPGSWLNRMVCPGIWPVWLFLRWACLRPHRPHSRHPAPTAAVTAESQADREARLFGVIRDDAARGMSIRQIAGRHRVHRRMVRQALAEPADPPSRKRGTRPAPAISPIQDVQDKLACEPLTVWEIWTTVTDEHDSDASYAAVRDYIRNRRLASGGAQRLGGSWRTVAT